MVDEEKIDLSRLSSSALYLNTVDWVIAYEQLSSKFIKSSGFLQDCVLSPFQFDFITDILSERKRLFFGFPEIDSSTSDSFIDLEYASDIVIFGEDSDSMQHSVRTE